MTNRYLKIKKDYEKIRIEKARKNLPIEEIKKSDTNLNKTLNIVVQSITQKI